MLSDKKEKKKRKTAKSFMTLLRSRFEKKKIKKRN